MLLGRKFSRVIGFNDPVASLWFWGLFLLSVGPLFFLANIFVSDMTPGSSVRDAILSAAWTGFCGRWLLDNQSRHPESRSK